MIEQTLVLIKPDGVQRSLVGRIITKFEDAGLKLIGIKMVLLSKEDAVKHYTNDLIPVLGEKTKKDWDKANIKYSETEEEIGRMIISGLRDFISSAPVIVMVIEGVHAVENVRKIIGATGPRDASPGTIRGDFAHLGLGYASTKKVCARNIIHASGSKEEAKSEIKLYFKEKELYTYKTVHDEHVL